MILFNLILLISYFHSLSSFHYNLYQNHMKYYSQYNRKYMSSDRYENMNIDKDNNSIDENNDVLDTLSEMDLFKKINDIASKKSMNMKSNYINESNDNAKEKLRKAQEELEEFIKNQNQNPNLLPKTELESNPMINEISSTERFLEEIRGPQPYNSEWIQCPICKTPCSPDEIVAFGNKCSFCRINDLQDINRKSFSDFGKVDLSLSASNKDMNINSFKDTYKENIPLKQESNILKNKSPPVTIPRKSSSNTNSYMDDNIEFISRSSYNNNIYNGATDDETYDEGYEALTNFELIQKMKTLEDEIESLQAQISRLYEESITKETLCSVSCFVIYLYICNNDY